MIFVINKTGKPINFKKDDLIVDGGITVNLSVDTQEIPIITSKDKDVIESLERSLGFVKTIEDGKWGNLIFPVKQKKIVFDIPSDPAVYNCADQSIQVKTAVNEVNPEDCKLPRNIIIIATNTDQRSTISVDRRNLYTPIRSKAHDGVRLTFIVVKWLNWGKLQFPVYMKISSDKGSSVSGWKLSSKQTKTKEGKVYERNVIEKVEDLSEIPEFKVNSNEGKKQYTDRKPNFKKYDNNSHKSSHETKNPFHKNKK